MDISTYFEQIQEYIKNNLNTPSEINDVIKELNKDNIMPIVNQDFNNGVSIEECGEKLLKSLNIRILDDKTDSDHINGDRVLNKMERKVLKYSEFVNEAKHYTTQENFMDNVITKLADIDPFI